MLLIDDVSENEIRFLFNNYWVDKNPIWANYVKGQTEPIQESYDPSEKTFTLVLEENGYLGFSLISL
jgi:hypothetical protein